MYTRTIYNRSCEKHNKYNIFHKQPLSFKHHYHRLDAFYHQCQQYSINSISGQYIDLERFKDIKVIRFIRDPRDLLISAYHYHKRNAEHWCNIRNPNDLDWMMVNGKVPNNILKNCTLSEYLNKASVEDGLLAEIIFRENHYESMLEWPKDDPRVKTYRYEDIMNNEAEVFSEVFDFLDMPFPMKQLGVFYSKKYRAGKKVVVQKNHIRNPTSKQWKDVFTPKVSDAFNKKYGNLLDRYGYPM